MTPDEIQQLPDEDLNNQVTFHLFGRDIPVVDAHEPNEELATFLESQCLSDAERNRYLGALGRKPISYGWRPPSPRKRVEAWVFAKQGGRP